MSSTWSIDCFQMWMTKKRSSWRCLIRRSPSSRHRTDAIRIHSCMSKQRGGGEISSTDVSMIIDRDGYTSLSMYSRCQPSMKPRILMKREISLKIQTKYFEKHRLQWHSTRALFSALSVHSASIWHWSMPGAMDRRVPRFKSRFQTSANPCLSRSVDGFCAEKFHLRVFVFVSPSIFFWSWII